VPGRRGWRLFDLGIVVGSFRAAAVLDVVNHRRGQLLVVVLLLRQRTPVEAQDCEGCGGDEEGWEVGSVGLPAH
jgi:hypothetical protein